MYNVYVNLTKGKQMKPIITHLQPSILSSLAQCITIASNHTMVIVMNFSHDETEVYTQVFHHGTLQGGGCFSDFNGAYENLTLMLDDLMEHNYGLTK